MPVPVSPVKGRCTCKTLHSVADQTRRGKRVNLEWRSRALNRPNPLPVSAARPERPGSSDDSPELPPDRNRDSSKSRREENRSEMSDW